MTSHLASPFPPLSLSSNPKSPPPTTPFTVTCGPRDNRGPLVKGRVLSSEAILAVQSLKRTNGPDPTKTLSRLIKSDLLATLHELLRQGRCDLALLVFSAVRSEPWYKIDLNLYAELALALDRNGMKEDIDRLIEEMEDQDDDGVVDWKENRKGLGRLIRALISSERKESTVRVYRVLKRNGWGVEVDEYVAGVLSKGFRRFGYVELADEVDLALDNYLKSCLGLMLLNK